MGKEHGQRIAEYTVRFAGLDGADRYSMVRIAS